MFSSLKKEGCTYTVKDILYVYLYWQYVLSGYFTRYDSQPSSVTQGFLYTLVMLVYPIKLYYHTAMSVSLLHCEQTNNGPMVIRCLDVYNCEFLCKAV